MHTVLLCIITKDNAFPAGIFIHVIFVEILAKEFGHGTDHNTEKEAYEPCATDEANSDTSGSQDTKKVKDESKYFINEVVCIFFNKIR